MKKKIYYKMLITFSKEFKTITELWWWWFISISVNNIITADLRKLSQSHGPQPNNWCGFRFNFFHFISFLIIGSVFWYFCWKFLLYWLELLHLSEIFFHILLYFLLLGLIFHFLGYVVDFHHLICKFDISNFHAFP